MKKIISRREALAQGTAALSTIGLLGIEASAKSPSQSTAQSSTGTVMAGIEPLPLEANTYSQLFPSGSPILDKLPNEMSNVSSFFFEANSSVSYLIANVAVKGQNVVVRQDYQKFLPFTKPGDNVVYRVGIAIRIVASVQILKGEVNTGGLLPLGIAASAGRVSGSLEMAVLGISGANITSAIPLPSQITPETVQKAIEAAAVIKSRIFDNPGNVTSGSFQPVTITPQYIAKQVSGPLSRDKNSILLSSGLAGASPFLNNPSR